MHIFLFVEITFKKKMSIVYVDNYALSLGKLAGAMTSSY